MDNIHEQMMRYEKCQSFYNASEENHSIKY